MTAKQTSTRKKDNDENYVIDLCDEVLNIKANRQARFDFLRGDKNSRQTARTLPVDAYYVSLNMVIEYCETQHDEEVPFFDKPHKLTISGVHRGMQRKKYDERRRILLPVNGIYLLPIYYHAFPHNKQKRIIRNKEQDLSIVRRLLESSLQPNTV